MTHEPKGPEFTAANTIAGFEDEHLMGKFAIPYLAGLQAQTQAHELSETYKILDTPVYANIPTQLFATENQPQVAEVSQITQGNVLASNFETKIAEAKEAIAGIFNVDPREISITKSNQKAEAHPELPELHEKLTTDQKMLDKSLRDEGLGLNSAAVVKQDTTDKLPKNVTDITKRTPVPKASAANTANDEFVYGSARATKERSRLKNKVAGALGKAALVIALAGAAIGIGERTADDEMRNSRPVAAHLAAPDHSHSDKPAKAKPKPELTHKQLVAKYGDHSAMGTGEHSPVSHNEIGHFIIDAKDPEQSKKNFYDGLRHNRRALAVWETCLETGTPSYEACVADEDVLAQANALAAKYSKMPLSEAAEKSEALIDKFEDAIFKGVTTESGTYKTVGMRDGQFVEMTNYRVNDGRLEFSFVNNGMRYNVEVRSCEQQTDEEEAPKKIPVPDIEVPEEAPEETPEAPEETPTPSPEETPTPTPEETPTPSPEETPTPTPEATPTPQPTRTPTPPTPTPTGMPPKTAQPTTNPGPSEPPGPGRTSNPNPPTPQPPRPTVAPTPRPNPSSTPDATPEPRPSAEPTAPARTPRPKPSGDPVIPSSMVDPNFNVMNAAITLAALGSTYVGSRIRKSKKK